MKKIALVFAAMLAMVQMNAATDAAPASESTPAEAAAPAAADVEESTFQAPFTRNDNTKHWAIITNGLYIGMGVKHNWNAINNSFEVGLLNAVGVRYNSLHGQTLSLGIGIHHRSYSMKRPNMLYRHDDSQIVGMDTYPSNIIGDIKNRSSNLNLWTVQFPLMFTQRIYKKLDITVAGIMNWNIYARVDNHFEMKKTEYDTRYKNLRQNKLNFDVMGALTWNELGIYCRYSPGKFFEKGYGPEIKNTWSLGLIIGI